MADDLTTIVQRMVDAGESEANIATYIQHFSQPYQPDPTTQNATAAALTRQSGFLPPPRRKTDELGNEVGGMDPGLIRKLIEGAVKNPALEGMAHPTDLTDVAGLAIPSSGVPGQNALSALKTPALRLGGAAAGGYAGYSAAPKDSPVKQTAYGLGGAILGAGAPDALSIVEQTPGLGRMAKPLTDAIERILNWNNPLTVAGREGRAAATAAQSFQAAAPTGGRVAARLIKSPQEIAAENQLFRALRPGAQLEGMKSAARTLPGDPLSAAPATLDELIRQLQESVK